MVDPQSEESALLARSSDDVSFLDPIYEYSDSEYDDNEPNDRQEQNHSALAPPTSDRDLPRRPGSLDSQHFEYLGQGWKHSSTSSEGTTDTVQYLRRNSFALSTSTATRSPRSRSSRTETEPNSPGSDLFFRIMPSTKLDGCKRTLSDSERLPPETSQHKRHLKRSFLKNLRQIDTCDTAFSGDKLIPEPLDIPLIQARRKASLKLIHESRAETRSLGSDGGDPAISSFASTPYNQKRSVHFLEAIDSDSDEEACLLSTQKAPTRATPQTGSILNIIDLRPAQATRNPSYIRHIQIIPRQTPILNAPSNAVDHTSDHVLQEYFTGSLTPLSETYLPWPRSEIPNKRVESGVKRIINRCKSTILRDKKR